MQFDSDKSSPPKKKLFDWSQYAPFWTDSNFKNKDVTVPFSHLIIDYTFRSCHVYVYGQTDGKYT